MERDNRRENKRDKFIKKSRIGTAEALKSRDMILGQASKIIDEIDEVIHRLTERLEDAYAVYFPELSLEDKRKYAQIALSLDRKNPDMQMLESLVGAGKATDIIAKTKNTLGADLKDADLGMVKDLARQIVELHNLRDKYDAYQESLAQEVCPNMKHVANASIGAKLIAHAGSLRKLALLPASTVQVLGAEKALFKHLRSKGRIGSPKHGIIFQYPQIGTAPKHQRGKIARALATKLAIAAKADAFSHRFIAEELKKDFDKRLEEIRAEAAQAKAAKPGNIPQSAPQPQRFGKRR